MVRSASSVDAHVAARVVAGSAPADGGLPLDPSVVVSLLARSIAAVHDGRSVPGIAEDPPRLDPRGVLDAARAALADGRRPPPGSPYGRSTPARLLEVLAAGLDEVVARSVRPVPTIGDATVTNLDVTTVPRSAEIGGSLLGSAARTDVRVTPVTLTARSGRSRADAVAAFREHRHAAMADPYRDLAIACADVVATFGPGAVIGFVQAYTSARPAVGPIDPVRLDWWSLAGALVGPGPSPVPSAG